MDTVNESNNKIKEESFKEYTILLVDDDDSFRKVTRQLLEDRGLRVYDAANGREAAAILGLKPVSLVLSDVRMPEMHGIELLHFVRQKCPKTPVMLMTGFADMIEMKEAYEIGARGFINKPFSVQDLECCLNDILNPAEEINLQNAQKHLRKRTNDYKATDFCRVAIEDFVNGSTIKFPFYVRLSEDKFVKVANRGEDLSKEMIARFKSRGVDYLYLLKNDSKEFLMMNTRMSYEVAVINGVDPARKSKIYANSLKHILKFAADCDFDSDIAEIVRKNVEMVVEVFTKEEDFSIFEQMATKAEDVYSHSIHVCLVATQIAKSLGWTSSQKMFVVTSAALLHDIGLLEIDSNLWKKSHTVMTKEERLEYENHPIRGAAIAKRMKGFPEGLDQIILQHHEFVDGSGFPHSLCRVKTHPIARIICIADAFCHEWDQTISKDVLSNPSRVFTRIDMRKDLFDRDFYHALKLSVMADSKNMS